MNPRFKYREEFGEVLSLAGLVENFYALSWTVDKDEKNENWEDFSHKNPSVRVTTTPRKLMNHVMNVDDKYFMHHHNMGLVHYHSKQEIIDWLQNSHYSDHLDSLGQGLALSIMILRTQFSSEQEARLIYSYSPQQDNPWVKDKIVVSGNRCILPFKWNGIIDEILLGPDISNSAEQDMRDFLQSQAINCNISSSQFRL